jgi:DNA-binding response OmpR family regulator
MNGRHVLVVDDDPYIRHLVKVVLEHHGLVVHDAHDGERALALVDELPIDVVLLDVYMPILNGPGFVAALREKRVDLPIVVMSGVLGASAWARSVDAAAVLFKPFSMTELLEVVEAVMPRVPIGESWPLQIFR